MRRSLEGLQCLTFRPDGKLYVDFLVDRMMVNNFKISDLKKVGNNLYAFHNPDPEPRYHGWWFISFRFGEEVVREVEDRFLHRKTWD